MHLLTKVFSFLFLSIAALHAQCSYTSAPRYSIEEREPWTVNTTATFIYWSLSQENMELGIVNDTSSSASFVNGNVVNSDFSYSPGFIVGLGWTLPPNHWDVTFQYTWLRSENQIATSLESGGDKVLAPFWQVPDPISYTYFFGKETWNVSFDFVDAITARSYFIGKGLLVRPFFGARNAWIRQKLEVEYLNETTNLTTHNVYVEEVSHSWAIGPRFGLDTKWLLGLGMRLYGNWGNDLLYTQYTKLETSQYATTISNTVVPGSDFFVEQKDLHHVRYHVDLELGFGWEKVFSKNGYRLDLAAAYTFQCFFHQNMFRKYVNDQFLESFSSAGDLDAHGLNATIRFDF